MANSNANVTQFNTFRGSNVTLSADALITGNRIDIGRDGSAFSTLDLAGHTLTLSMSGSQPMFGIESHGSVTAGNIVVVQGALDIEQSAVVQDTAGKSAITFNDGANAQFWQTAGSNVTRLMVFNGNNTIGSGSCGGDRNRECASDAQRERDAGGFGERHSECDGHQLIDSWRGTSLKAAARFP